MSIGGKYHRIQDVCEKSFDRASINTSPRIELNKMTLTWEVESWLMIFLTYFLTCCVQAFRSTCRSSKKQEVV